MLIPWSQLHHLPVKTASGQIIGQVDGVTVSIEGHTIHRYEVKPGQTILAFFSKPFLVSPTQVIDITVDAMIVEDTVVKELQGSQAKTKLALETASPELDLSEAE